MGRMTIQMIDLVEIYVHWYAGRSQAQIADSLGLDRKRYASTWRQLRRLGWFPVGCR
jgi:hypothetical protein